LSMNELKSLNGIKHNVINVGQTLKVKKIRPSAVAQNSDAIATLVNTDENKGEKNTTVIPPALTKTSRVVVKHKVKSGETLSGVALRYNTSMAEIKALNELKKNSIRIGQVLKINQTVIETVPSVVSSTRIHKVASGETLSGIALRYSSSVTAIRKQNKLNGTAIRIGQTLVIPTVEG